MIKIVAISPAGAGPELILGFSDGSEGHWSAAALIERDSILTRPLADRAFFERCFIEGGALAWPNGLELSPVALHDRLAEAGALRWKAA